MFCIAFDEPKTTGYLVIEDDGIDQTADSITTEKPSHGVDKFDQCCQWLQEAIPSEGKFKDDVIAEGKASGYGYNLIYSAFKFLNGESKKQFSGKAKWVLPILHGSHREEWENDHSSHHTVKNGSPLENKGETSLFDGKTPNLPGHTCARDDWGKTAENAPVGLSEFTAFADTPPPRNCQECAYHRPATYPDGLCKEGLCQQDLPCCAFVESTIDSDRFDCVADKR
jgi:hypothetical protein